MKILLIEDDQSTGEFLTSILTAHRYTVDLASDGQTGLELADLWKYDLILLDIELPRLDGFSVCRELRDREHKTPILILTGKSQTQDIIVGLDAGADDYMIKPCDADQLLARIRALLRRSSTVSATILSWGNLYLDPALGQVSYGQQAIALGPKEYNLLELFLRNPQRIFNRSAILDNLWTANDFPTENAVTNLIKDLRRKLKAAGMKDDLIETIYGLGYRLKSAPGQPTSDKERGAADPSCYQEGIASINQLAQQFRASLEQRLAFLMNALRSRQLAELDTQQRESARQEAHRLAGALGMFGYGQGVEAARSVEAVLQTETPTPAQVEQAFDLLINLKQAIAASSSPLSLSTLETEAGLLSVVVFEPNLELLELLQREGAARGMRVQVIDVPIHHHLTDPPAVLLVNWRGETPVEKAVFLTETLKEHFPMTPLLILSEQDSLEHRVIASRLGCQLYLGQPVEAAQLWEAIAQVNGCGAFQQGLKPTTATILVVDPDPEMLSTLQSLLQPWGLQVIGLAQPEQFWQVLSQVNPDLLVLDLESPKFSGIDLCRVVRQDLVYRHLPVLVMTTLQNTRQMQCIFDAGADDLLYKPVVGLELVARIMSRLERARLRQQLDLMQQQQTETLQLESRVDVLTQVANRRRFDECLAREWHCHQRSQTTLSLILCDVDFFKLFNDCYGHPAGDACLKQVAQVIQSCVNPLADLVARYGGEEFGVILPNTDLNGALRVAERIQAAIAVLSIPHTKSPVCQHVTLSMGITGAIPTPKPSFEQLIATADQALYAAKERGRNTYCLYAL